MIIMIWYYHVWLWVKLQPQHMIVSGSTAQGPGFCVPTEMWGDPCLHILDPVATHDHTGTVLSSQEDDEIVAMLVAISWCKDPMKQDAELTISHGAHWVSICFHWTSSHSSLETLWRSGVKWSSSMLWGNRSLVDLCGVFSVRNQFVQRGRWSAMVKLQGGQQRPRNLCGC